jgi:hypothetical protein
VRDAITQAIEKKSKTWATALGGSVDRKQRTRGSVGPFPAGTAPPVAFAFASFPVSGSAGGGGGRNNAACAQYAAASVAPSPLSPVLRCGFSSRRHVAIGCCVNPPAAAEAFGSVAVASSQNALAALRHGARAWAGESCKTATAASTHCSAATWRCHDRGREDGVDERKTGRKTGHGGTHVRHQRPGSML